MRQTPRTKRLPAAAAAVAAVIGCASLAASVTGRDASGFVDQKNFRRVPVVMVVFDEFPVATLMNTRGKVDAGLFPSFAALQRDSTWFRNTTTPSVFTDRALPALLTGLYPESGNKTEDRRASLFNVLGGSYNIRARELELDHLCPGSACEDTSTSLMPRLRRRYGHFFPAARGEKFLRLLSFIRGADQPRFFFMHLVMPHQPWRYLPTGQAYPQVSPIPGELDSPGLGKEWARDGWLVTQAYQRHLLQTALLDRQLGVLLDRLHKREMYGRSLIVVTADHGIAYAPGASKRIVTEKTVGHIAPVPLFLKLPFQAEGRISDRPLETIDIPPTIADVLGLSNRPRVDGISALRKRFPRHRRRFVESIKIGPETRSKFEVAEMKYEMFSKRDGALDLFLVGPGNTERFVGRFVDEFLVSAPGSETVRVKNSEEIESTQPDAPLLPALLEGILNGSEAEAGEKIAIALDGRIVAVTRTYKQSRLVRFYAMLPPQWFGEPPNELELYRVDGGGADVLVPLPRTEGTG